MKKTKQMLALLLSFSLCMTAIPMPAIAADSTPTAEPNESIQETTEFYDPTGNCKEYPTTVYDTTDPTAITGLVTVCEDYDTSPMYVGEERIIRFWNPETLTAGDAQITDSHTIRWFECSYDEELGAMRIKATSPGVTTFYCLAEGCDHPVRIELCAVEPETTIAASGVTCTETLDWAPTATYEKNHLDVGEEMTVQFSVNHPVSGARIASDPKDVVSITDFDDSHFVVTGLKDGKVNLTLSFPECPVVYYIFLTVGEVQPTTEFYDPTGHCVEPDLYEPTSEIPPTDVHHDPVEPTTEIETQTETIPETHMETHIDAAPTLDYERDVLAVGECMTIRYKNPIDGSTEGASISVNNEEIASVTETGDGWFTVEAKKPGDVNISVIMPGCTMTGHAFLTIEEAETTTEFYDPTGHCVETDLYEPTTEIPPTDVHHDPIEPTTEYYDPTDSCIETYTETMPDAAPTLDYERDVLAVGEYLTIRYQNPIDGSTKNASVSVNNEEIASVMETGDGWLIVKAVTPGEVNISVSMPGCSMIGHAFLKVEEAYKLLEMNLGKLDGDEQVNSKDGVIILKDAAYYGAHGTHNITEEQQKNADVNKDGFINAADATCVLMYSANAGTEKYPPLFPRYMEKRKVLSVKETQDYTSIDSDPIRNVIAEDKPIIFAADDYEAFCSILSDYIGDALIHDDTDQKTHKLSELTTKYDEAWFQENSLICAAIKDPSYGVRYTNKGITGDSENGFTLHLTRDAYYAADMIETHFLFIEISKTYSASDLIRVFDVDVENVTTKPENHFFGYATERVQYTNKADAISLYTSAEAYAAFPYDFPSELSKDAEKFFAEYNLLVLERTVGSGSYRFKVEGIDVADGICTVNLVKTSPGLCTADMASWVIFIAVDKTIANAETITVNQTIQHI